MDTPVPPKPASDLRDYLAEERTFLAWIRTGLTLMGFGFVVARFGLFLEVMQINRGGPAAPSQGISRWFGTAFIVVGVIVNLLSMRRHQRQIDALNSGQISPQRPAPLAIGLALFLAAVGIAMAIYLISA